MKNHPISIKFGAEQRIWNSMTVTDQMWIFKVQNGGRPLY